ncbi:MAG: hypothetical protein EOM23_02095 [Candidatus Moranbacteria bacterium]|nr:hypothetical protein [Candidatus Moranbacteria bacterium]
MKPNTIALLEKTFGDAIPRGVSVFMDAFTESEVQLGTFHAQNVRYISDALYLCMVCAMDDPELPNISKSLGRMAPHFGAYAMAEIENLLRNKRAVEDTRFHVVNLRAIVLTPVSLEFLYDGCSKLLGSTENGEGPRVSVSGDLIRKLIITL